MKNASTILLGALLAMCLTLYGTVSMARAGGGAVFSMEICADGVAKTVLFDADGNPIEPAQSCPDCLTCCQAISALLPTIFSALSSVVLLNMEVDRLHVQNPPLNKRNIHPAPRGPPSVQLSMLNMLGLITFDRSAIGQTMRSDGRLMLKDASA